MEDQEEVRILRDTGAMQSFILAGKVQLSDITFCGSNHDCLKKNLQ